MKTNAVTKYLLQYAEAEVNLLETFPEKFYRQVLIIPAYQETPDFIDTYLSGQFASLLVILIINQPDTDDDQSSQSKLIQHIEDNSRCLWSEQHLSLQQSVDPSTDILCIRRYQDQLRINAKYGVGLARKIAADCALKLIHGMRIESNWIACTDADAQLPNDYFQRLHQHPNCSALTFDYHHEVNQGPVSQATQLYEQSLKYYQSGLAWAGSPFAFHSLGSSLAVNAFDYAKVRGFPKRPAGEDFYLLNKLCKIGEVKHCQDTQIIIQSRLSERVPFGTGPAIAKILRLEDPLHYCYYDPQVFTELKHCLNALATLSPTEHMADWRKAFSEQHVDWLFAEGLERIFVHHQHQKLAQEALTKSLHIWFDGLLTLRFIHYIRDQFYPNCYLVEALEKSPFCATYTQ